MVPIEIMCLAKGPTLSKLLQFLRSLEKDLGSKLGLVFILQSSGKVTDEMIKIYLEHHFEPKKNDGLKIES